MYQAMPQDTCPVITKHQSKPLNEQFSSSCGTVDSVLARVRQSSGGTAGELYGSSFVWDHFLKQIMNVLVLRPLLCQRVD